MTKKRIICKIKKQKLSKISELSKKCYYCYYLSNNFIILILKKGNNGNLSISQRWCTITYWEYNRPYNQQFHVTNKTSYIFRSKHAETRFQDSQYFNLESIFNNTDDNELILMRDEIQNGVKLWFDENTETIWMKNLSNINIYWVCPVLASTSESSSIQTLKPLSSSSIIYDFKILELKIKENEDLKLFDPHVVNMSFKNNWGVQQRKSIEQCPCWLNLSVNVDFILMMREKEQAKRGGCKIM